MSITLLPRSSRPESLEVQPERPRGDGPDPVPLGRRLVPVAAAATLLVPFSESWDYVVASPESGLIAIGLIAVDLLLLVLLMTASSLDGLRRLERWLLTLAALSLIVVSAGYLAGSTGYGSDEAALTQGAARALLAGHDPYGANLSSALGAYLAQSIHATQLLNGQVVHTYGYPALPMLLVVPVVWLTGGGQAVPLAYTLVLVAAMVLMFRRLPDGFRALAIIMCAGLTLLWMGSMDGMTQIVTMAPLIYVAAGWSRVGSTGRLSRQDWACAMAMGLALSANQVSWFIAPFLWAGIYLVNAGPHGRRVARSIVVRFTAGAAMTFLVLNGPFMIWSPAAWLSGTSAPVLQHAIPLGQGLVGLTLFARIGGGDLSAYAYAALSALAGGLFIYIMWFRKLARAGFVLPMLALFLSPRSLGSYWMLLVAVIVTSVAADDSSRFDGAVQGADSLPSHPIAKHLTAAALLPTVFCLAWALGSSAPLAVNVVGESGRPTEGDITKLVLSVSNRSSHPISPHFALSSVEASGMTPFWRVLVGPRVLGPGTTARYEILAGDSSYAVSGGERFLVYAVGDHPESVSSSRALTAPGTAPVAASSTADTH